MLANLWPFSCTEPAGVPRSSDAGGKEDASLNQKRRSRAHERSWAAIFSNTKKSFAAVVEVLTPNKHAVAGHWKRKLHETWPRGQGLGGVEKIDLWEIARGIPGMRFQAFRMGIEKFGEELAQREVPLEQVVLTADAFLEITLRYLMDHAECAAAVLRLDSVARYFLVSAYSHYQESRVHMLQSQLSEAEHRLHGASAYVTNVYEQERRRLSHDLHDDIGHDLVMLKLHLELLATDLGQRKLSSLRPRLDDARALVGHTLDSIRRLVLDLGPAVFDDLGFVPALKLYVRRFTASTGIEVSLEENHLPGDVPLSHQTAIYRILQGALSNVLKHAQAKHVKVALAGLRNSVLVMSIEDDGVGFDTGSGPRHQFGLTAMRERTAVLGGRLHIQSWRASPLGARHGTRIEVDLPLPTGIQ